MSDNSTDPSRPSCVSGGTDDLRMTMPVVLLRDLRAYIADDLEILLSSYCVRVRGRWNRSTLAGDELADVSRADTLLARIDAALKKVGV